MEVVLALWNQIDARCDDDASLLEDWLLRFERWGSAVDRNSGGEKPRSSLRHGAAMDGEKKRAAENSAQKASIFFAGRSGSER